MFEVVVVISVYLVVAIVALAAARPDYSHRRDTISQLGERGAVRAKFAGRGVFLPVGFALLGVAVWSVRADGHVALLALCIGVGYTIGGAFPCDRGEPRHGSWRQNIHEASGLVEYAGSAYAVQRLSAQSGPWFVVGVVASVFIVLAPTAGFFRPLRNIRGLLQRIAESLVFGALLLAAYALSGT